MKFFIYFTCFMVVLIISGYSMEEVEIEGQRVESGKGAKANSAPRLKRSRSLSGDSTSPDKTSKTKNANTNDADIVIPPEIMDRIRDKADRLKPQLEKASILLNKIHESLYAKARNLRDTDLRRATELAGVGTSAKGMISTTLGILRNINGFSLKGEDPLLNRSIAVIASGALKDQLEDLIVCLSDKPDTRDIDCTALKSVRAAIHDVTKDIPNFILEEHDD
jgi:hypothetical protein